MQVEELMPFFGKNKMKVMLILILFCLLWIVVDLFGQISIIRQYYKSQSSTTLPPSSSMATKQMSEKSWPLFGLALDSLASENLPWKLIGIFASSQSQFSTIIIESNGIQRQIALRGTLPDGSVLEQIESHRIIIKKGGKLVEIPLSLKDMGPPPQVNPQNRRRNPNLPPNLEELFNR